MNENVILSKVSLEDIEILMELNNNEYISNFVVGNPKKVNFNEQLQWMKKNEYETNTIRFIIKFGIFSVGTIIISSIDKCNKSANISIKILPDYHGKGIGKTALILAIKHAFYVEKIYCLTAHILDYNVCSQNLFKSVGFILEGILRSRIIKNDIRYNLLSYSLLYDDFLKLNF